MKAPTKHRPLFPKKREPMKVPLQNLVWVAIFITILWGSCQGVGCTSIKGDTLIMSELAEKKLKLGYENFIERLGVEYAFCTYGRRDGTRVYIDDVELAWGVNLPLEVLFVTDYCLNEPFGWGHAHPFSIDTLSSRDWYLVNKMPYDGTLLVYEQNGSIQHRYFRRGGDADR